MAIRFMGLIKNYQSHFLCVKKFYYISKILAVIIWNYGTLLLHSVLSQTIVLERTLAGDKRDVAAPKEENADGD